MYFTKKIRIRMKEEEKRILLEYEQTYMDQLQDLVKQMEEGHSHRLSQMAYFHEVPIACRWQLYQFARKQYFAIKNKKDFQYHRSSTWSTKAFHYEGDMLSLFMRHQDLHLKLSISTFEMDLLNTCRIVRLDIVHDEKFWYANFTLCIKEKVR
ncbi:hypothetical protein [Amedibacillus sp. YH-ame10]